MFTRGQTILDPMESCSNHMKSHEFPMKSHEFPMKSPMKSHEFPMKSHEFQMKSHEFPMKPNEIPWALHSFNGVSGAWRTSTAACTAWEGTSTWWPWSRRLGHWWMDSSWATKALPVGVAIMVYHYDITHMITILHIYTYIYNIFLFIYLLIYLFI